MFSPSALTSTISKCQGQMIIFLTFELERRGLWDNILAEGY